MTWHKPPAWWPPKVGDKLRHATLYNSGGPEVEALQHVLAVFEDKAGEPRIVTAEWSPTKRGWIYEVFSWHQAATGIIWPDCTRRPKES